MKANKKKRGRSKGSKESGTAILILIALFKLVKALLLIAVGIGALRLLHKDVGSVLEHWVEVLRVDPDNHFVHSLLVRLFAVTPKQLEALGAGTFFYAALLLTEGVGLLMRKHWAEYFTVITTALLIPLEVFEMVKHLTTTKVVVLVINVAIVVYLIQRIRGRRRFS
jgi:uncharacterized membrane protein (DUF2068 family)